MSETEKLPDDIVTKLYQLGLAPPILADGAIKHSSSEASLDDGDNTWVCRGTGS
jgi:hypothetical protein